MRQQLSMLLDTGCRWLPVPAVLPISDPVGYWLLLLQTSNRQHDPSIEVASSNLLYDIEHNTSFMTSIMTATQLQPKRLSPHWDLPQGTRGWFTVRQLYK